MTLNDFRLMTKELPEFQLMCDKLRGKNNGKQVDYV